jgi:NDP-sugar pyrophosphorylase family protein
MLASSFVPVSATSLVPNPLQQQPTSMFPVSDKFSGLRTGRMSQVKLPDGRLLPMVVAQPQVSHDNDRFLLNQTALQHLKEKPLQPFAEVFQGWNDGEVKKTYGSPLREPALEVTYVPQANGKVELALTPGLIKKRYDSVPEFFLTSAKPVAFLQASALAVEQAQQAAGNPSSLDLSLQPTKGTSALTLSGTALPRHTNVHVFSSPSAFNVMQPSTMPAQKESNTLWQVDALRPELPIAFKPETPGILSLSPSLQPLAKEPFTACFTCGGEATRFRPLLAKPMHELVAGYSNLQRLIMATSYAGANRIFITIPAEQQEAYAKQTQETVEELKLAFAKEGRAMPQVTLLPEGKKLGDSSVLHFLREQPDVPKQQPLLVIYGDSVIQLPFGKLIDELSEAVKALPAQDPVGLVVAEKMANNKIINTFGLLVTRAPQIARNALHDLVAFNEKPASDQILRNNIAEHLHLEPEAVSASNYANSGIVALNPPMLSLFHNYFDENIAEMGKIQLANFLTWVRQHPQEVGKAGDHGSEQPKQAHLFVYGLNEASESLCETNKHDEKAPMCEAWIDVGDPIRYLQAVNLFKEKVQNAFGKLAGTVFPAKMPEQERETIADVFRLKQPEQGLNAVVVKHN